MATAIRLMQRVSEIVDETYQCRQYAQCSRDTEYRAAVCIQSWFRAVRVRAYLRYLNHCAIVVQKLWRGWMDRDRFRRDLKQRVYGMKFQHYTKLATVIQKHWRGYRSRKYVFDFYGRKQYFEKLEQKNDQIRKELHEYTQQEIEHRKLKAEEAKLKRIENFANRNHHLVSTFVQAGVYNSPFKEKPNELELQLRSAKPTNDRTRNWSGSASKVKVIFDPAWTRYDVERYSPLPPLPDRQMGPFRDPDDVQRQRYKPFQPTLRVATDFFAVDAARQKVKAEEWVGRISDVPYVPCKRQSPRPYEPLLGTSGKFRQIAYGTRTFRQENPDVWLSKNFRTVVPPIPVFDRFNDTYSSHSTVV